MATTANAYEIINVSGTLSAKENTIDEPVSMTIMRDVRLVQSKLKVVLMPTNNSEETLKALRDWDLWGPLMLCLILSIILSITAPAHQSAMVFTGVFVIVWLGAAIVTINAQLLGSTISFFQSICVLGYCIFPLTIVAFLLLFLHLIVQALVLRLALVTCGFFWSTKASVVFLSQLVPPSRRLLAVYPVIYFYIFVLWFSPFLSFYLPVISTYYHKRMAPFLSHQHEEETQSF